MSGKPHAARHRLSDVELIDAVQRATFRYFWDFADPASGLARDRFGGNDRWLAIGGSGFGAMAIVVAAERGWVERGEAVERLHQMLRSLEGADAFHGAFPHFVTPEGRVIRFGRKDDGADIVETALLVQGLIAAREYFHRDQGQEPWLRGRIDGLIDAVEWDWFTRGGREAYYWHWSPHHGFAMNHEILGWNECLIALVLAAGARRNAIDPPVYHNGYTQSRTFLNGRRHEDILLPLGPDGGGPLFFAHYSFLGLDPRGLKDAYADYFEQNLAHVRINRAYCIRNPKNFAGYGHDCWGLTASDNQDGYAAHAPDNDLGVIAPTAAIASLPYAPDLVMPVLRHFHDDLGERLFGPLGFVDAFNPTLGWFAKTHLAIDQGPIVAMIENHRSGLLWQLVMGNDIVRRGLARLGFTSPHLVPGVL